MAAMRKGQRHSAPTHRRLDRTEGGARAVQQAARGLVVVVVAAFHLMDW